MNAGGLLDGEALQGFVQDALALLHGQRLKGLILEPRDFLPFVEVPHPALKADIATGAAIEQVAARRLGIDGHLGKAKPHQPPATGGMKTTASPSARGRDQSQNSLFTATFNCSRVKLKP